MVNIRVATAKYVFFIFPVSFLTSPGWCARRQPFSAAFVFNGKDRRGARLLRAR